MNKFIALIAALAFAGTAFAQTPAPKSEKAGETKGAVKSEPKKADKADKKKAGGKSAEKKAEAKK